MSRMAAAIQKSIVKILIIRFVFISLYPTID